MATIWLNNSNFIETNQTDFISEPKSDVKKELTETNKRLSGIEKTMEKIESLLGWLKWIGGGIVAVCRRQRCAIALSLIANFVYSLIA